MSKTYSSSHPQSLMIAKVQTYTITELAREFGITARALRFYEDKDLLHPARDGLTRIYSTRDRARLKLIMRGKSVGLPLADIREILDLYSISGDQRVQLRTTLDKFRKQVLELEKQRDDIEKSLEELHKGIAWAEEQLNSSCFDEGASRNIEAYDAIARAHMDR